MERPKCQGATSVVPIKASQSISGFSRWAIFFISNRLFTHPLEFFRSL
jgi:hypothetical protein